MKSFKASALLGTVGFAVLGLSASNAATIIGASDLLTPVEADFLAAHIAGSPNTFTKIYDYSVGDDSGEFHDAVGATRNTIVVGRITGDHGTFRVGGFNPEDWSGSFGYRPADGSFLFNIENSTIFENWTDRYNPNIYAIVAYPTYWPTFGGGHDLTFGGAGTYSYLGYSYNDHGTGQYGLAGTFHFTWSEMEIFAVSSGAPAVPEPATWAMMIGGFALAGAAMRRRNAATTVRFV